VKPTKKHLLILVSAIVFIVVYTTVIAPWDHRGEEGNRIAILDPLPGEVFTSQCVELFESAGFEVDVLKGEEVSVAGIKRISGGYRIVIFRVHSTIYHGKVWFFTGERYRQGRYVLEQLSEEVHPARPSQGSDYLFAVGCDFVLHYLEDRFDGSLVVVMGCDGLSYHDLARAFEEVGASAYVSWDGPVSLGHTDEATLAMFRGLVDGGMCLREAVRYSMDLVGPDPRHDSTLSYYPDGGGAFELTQ
jgi:hypothetical protein